MKVIHLIPAMLCVFAVLFIGGYQIGKYSAKPTSPTAAVLDLRTIGSACTMKEYRFDAQTAKTGREPSAWYWRDAEGQFCADMHHVNNPDIDMDDWRSVYAIGINSKAVFEHEADAVQWVESQPYRQGAKP